MSVLEVILEVLRGHLLEVMLEVRLGLEGLCSMLNYINYLMRASYIRLNEVPKESENIGQRTTFERR